MTNNHSQVNKVVLAKMPRAGLGNKLFCFAHAIIFSEINKLTLFYSGLTQFHIGTYLRREKSKRYYTLLFRKGVKLNFLKTFFRKKQYIDYNSCETKVAHDKNYIYTFNQVPSWNDYFKYIRENRSLVIEKLNYYLNEDINSKLSNKNAPSIGVHIRMGDFKKLQQNEDFEKVGAARTPLTYFVDLILRIRSIAGFDLDVTIFTDGNIEELEEVFCLPKVFLAAEDSDVMQLLHLSKSNIILLSAGSTFGQWAAFLSNAAIVNHYHHFHSYIRDKETNNILFEGVCHPNENLPELLIENIKKIIEK